MHKRFDKREISRQGKQTPITSDYIKGLFGEAKRQIQDGSLLGKDMYQKRGNMVYQERLKKAAAFGFEMAEKEKETNRLVQDATAEFTKAAPDLETIKKAETALEEDIKAINSALRQNEKIVRIAKKLGRDLAPLDQLKLPLVGGLKFNEMRLAELRQKKGRI